VGGNRIHCCRFNFHDRSLVNLYYWHWINHFTPAIFQAVFKKNYLFCFVKVLYCRMYLSPWPELSTLWIWEKIEPNIIFCQERSSFLRCQSCMEVIVRRKDTAGA
jgi:hypothetical protein